MNEFGVLNADFDGVIEICDSSVYSASLDLGWNLRACKKMIRLEKQNAAECSIKITFQGS